MRRFIVLLIITGTVWAQTGLDKLVLDDGTEFLGEYSGVMENMVYFKPTNALAFQGIPINRIRSLQLRDGKTIIEDEYIKIRTILDYKHLSIKDKAIYDAKKDARKWILFTPTAVLTLAVSSFPYLLLEALTSKKTENFNSKDKQLYEKVYFEEYKKRKYKNFMISTGCTALIAGAVLFSFFSNFGFGSDYDIYVGP